MRRLPLLFTGFAVFVTGIVVASFVRLLLGLLVPTALAGRWLLSDLRIHRSNFPTYAASHGLGLTVGAPDIDQHR